MGRAGRFLRDLDVLTRTTKEVFRKKKGPAVTRAESIFWVETACGAGLFAGGLKFRL
jgi:hypothetical protein